MEFNSYSGSNIIPPHGVFNYLLFVTCLTVIVYFMFRKKFTISFVSLFTKIQVFTFLLLLGGILIIFSPPIAIKHVKIDQNPTENYAAKIEIEFTHFVKRSLLEKNLFPSLGGTWAFENPLYGTHLYNKLVFYSHFPLSPSKTYTISLAHVSNFIPFLPTQSYKTYISPSSGLDVLGLEANQENEKRITVLGSFPQDGWKGLAVDTAIKVRFNKPIYPNSGENSFSIFPSIPGSFKTDGDSLIFTPDTPLLFDTKYTFFVNSGVEGDGMFESIHGYAASFTTQPKETKLTVPVYLQKYALSCEASALRMALAYRGVFVGEDELLKLIGYDPNAKNGDTWGNPYVGFVGNVVGTQMVSGYGVYWEPIAKAANHYRYATSFENESIQTITSNIEKSTPTVVWFSIGAKEPFAWKTPTGDTIKAVSDEHTVIVTGFLGPARNPTHIIINDPLSGEMYLTKESFEKKWNSLGNSGVWVY